MKKRSWLNTLATTVVGWLGAYTSTDPRNTITLGFRPRAATANEIAFGDLPLLRNQCRDLDRRNPTFRGAIEGLVANIVGTGIDLEPDTGNPATDQRLRPFWREYLKSCGINGEDIDDLQALGCREALTVGSLVWRLVTLPERAAQGLIPIVVLPLEVEWLSPTPVTALDPGNHFVTGVECDAFGRECYFHLRNPDLTSDQHGRAERISVAELIHWFDRRRALQAQGEPWLSPSIETLFVERDLVRAELSSAKNTAAMSVFITSNQHPEPGTDSAGNATTDIAVGSVIRGYPGEDVKTLSHTRPSQQIQPFRSMLCGDMAAAARIGKRWINRDISQANYSSTRIDQQDEERLIGPVRERFGHGTIGRIYRAVLPYLCIKAGIPLPPATYRLVPDGTPYVNPKEDIEAALLAIRGGLSTFGIEAGKRGKTQQELITAIKEELKDPVLAMIFSATSPSTGTISDAIANRSGRTKAEVDAEFIDRITAAQKHLESNGLPKELWTAVIAAGGSDNAPGAFIGAIGKSSDQTNPEAPPSEPDNDDVTPPFDTERCIEVLRPIRNADGLSPASNAFKRP